MTEGHCIRNRVIVAYADICRCHRRPPQAPSKIRVTSPGTAPVKMWSTLRAPSRPRGGRPQWSKAARYTTIFVGNKPSLSFRRGTT
jgi:hypothetical protein